MRRFILCAAIVLFGVGQVEGSLLVNGGFEIPEATQSPLPAPLPAVFGEWNGNRSAIVGNENGIVPSAGNGMLSFLGTVPTNGAYGMSSDVGQFVDLSSYGSEIATGLVTAHASANFNRVDGGSRTDTLFGLLIWAYDGVPGSPPKADRIAFADSQLLSDANPDTWESLTTDLLLPSNTDRVAVMLIAYENVLNDGQFPEFHGHYVDDVTLTLSGVASPIPEPSTLIVWSLLGLTFGGVGYWRRRRR